MRTKSETDRLRTNDKSAQGSDEARHECEAEKVGISPEPVAMKRLLMQGRGRIAECSRLREQLFYLAATVGPIVIPSLEKIYVILVQLPPEQEWSSDL